MENRSVDPCLERAEVTHQHGRDLVPQNANRVLGAWRGVDRSSE